MPVRHRIARSSKLSQENFAGVPAPAVDRCLPLYQRAKEFASKVGSNKLPTPLKCCCPAPGQLDMGHFDFSSRARRIGTLLL